MAARAFHRQHGVFHAQQSRRATATLAGTLCAFVVACSGGGHDEATDPNDGTGNADNWNIAASMSRSALTIPQGASDTLTITVTRSGGFTGALTFSTTAPPSTTAQVSNVTTVGTTTTALLTVTTSPAHPVVASSQVIVLVQAQSGSLQGKSVTLTYGVTRRGLTVLAAGGFPLPRGATGAAVTVNLTRIDLTGDITMSFDRGAAPAGITATFLPNPVGGTSTVMTVVADTTVPAGSYALTIRATSGVYVASHTTTATVTIPPLP